MFRDQTKPTIIFHTTLSWLYLNLKCIIDPKQLISGKTDSSSFCTVRVNFVAVVYHAIFIVLFTELIIIVNTTIPSNFLHIFSEKKVRIDCNVSFSCVLASKEALLLYHQMKKHLMVKWIQISNLWQTQSPICTRKWPIITYISMFQVIMNWYLQPSTQRGFPLVSGEHFF